MSLPGNDGFERGLLSAKERDLEPLLETCVMEFFLDHKQAGEMEFFLNEAWFSGARSSHTQLRQKAAQRNFDVAAIDIAQIEVEFKALMEASAAQLNLSMGGTIAMWDYLGKAWRAGARACETELVALLIEARTDVAEEALEWLERRDEPEP